MAGLELISFKLCPFVQRAVIVLLEKGVDFQITYIDLKDKPDWFLALSPLGKVPVLKVGDEVLFESAVIAEYLDETQPPALHPADPLLRARNRAWIEFSSELLMDQYRMMRAPTQEEFQSAQREVRAKLERLEAELAAAPFFNGGCFALVDAAFAPGWMRLDLLERECSLQLREGLPKVEAWSCALMERKSVQDSVVPEFAQLFRGSLQEMGSFLGELC